MPFQVLPPSVVRSTDVHGLCEHGAVPRTQPSLADTNVIEMGRKPGGTGPPGGTLTLGRAAIGAPEAAQAPASAVAAAAAATAPALMTDLTCMRVPLSGDGPGRADGGGRRLALAAAQYDVRPWHFVAFKRACRIGAGF